MDARPYHTLALLMLENGLISKDTLLNECLAFLSDSDIETILTMYELLNEEEEE